MGAAVLPKCLPLPGAENHPDYWLSLQVSWRHNPAVKLDASRAIAFEARAVALTRTQPSTLFSTHFQR